MDDEWQTSVSSYEPIDNPAKFQRLIFDELNFDEAIQDICDITWRDKATMIQYDTFFWVKENFMHLPKDYKNMIMRWLK